MTAAKVVYLFTIYTLVVIALVAFSAPTTDTKPAEANNSSIGADLTIEFNANSSQTFTCHEKPMGYYADIEHNCKVYHFCLQGDFDGQLVSQRVSYLCLNQTLFDQQTFDCVAPSNMSAPCQESSKFYESSNIMLKQVLETKVPLTHSAELSTVTPS